MNGAVDKPGNVRDEAMGPIAEAYSGFVRVLEKRPETK